jgi:hypothetical protein
VWRGRKDLRLTGGGTISGNTRGQRGWSRGYSQITNGTLVAGYGDATGSNERVTIEDLTLLDHFSNALVVSGWADTRDHAIKILGVRARDTGEGPLVMNADDVTMRDVSFENVSVPAPAHPGDGLELWNVARFVMSGITVRGMLGGSAIDLYGARYGTLEDFVIEGVREGLSVAENTSMHTYSDRVLVKNGTIRLTGVGTALFTKGVRVRDVTISAVKAFGPSLPGSIGFQISSDNAQKSPDDNWRQEGPVTLEGCEARGFDVGLLIKTVANLSVKGGEYSDNQATPHSDGILWMGQGNARAREDTRGLFVSGVSAHGNRRVGMHIDAQGIMGFEADGFLSNCSFGGNGADGYHVSYTEPGLIEIGNLTVDKKCHSFAVIPSPSPVP